MKPPSPNPRRTAAETNPRREAAPTAAGTGAIRTGIRGQRERGSRKRGPGETKGGRVG